MNFRLSKHAREELERRQIPPALLDSVLNSPEQIVPEQGGTRVYPSRLDFGGGSVFCSARSWMSPWTPQWW